MWHVSAFAFCLIISFANAHTNTYEYDGDKGYNVAKPVLAEQQAEVLPVKQIRLGGQSGTPKNKSAIILIVPASAATGQQTSAALLAEIPSKLQALIDNKLKSTADPKLRCLFNEDDLVAVGLSKYVDVTRLLNKNKRLCLWSGITTKNAQKLVDEKSGCIRLENTPLGYYLETKFNQDEKDKNYPKNALPCHKTSDWTVGGTRWPGLKIEGMSFLRSLWSFGSKYFALQAGDLLTVVLNTAGNFKGRFSGDTFSTIEFPAVVKRGKTTKISIELFTDHEDYKDGTGKKKELRQRKYSCASHEYTTLRRDAASDLRVSESNIKCNDTIKI